MMRPRLQLLGGVVVAIVIAGIWGQIRTTLEVASAAEAAANQQPAPPQQPGADFHVYSPKLHPIYDGQFRVTCSQVYHVGMIHDEPGWDHIDNEASTAYPVEGTVEIEVDEINNTGTVVAKFSNVKVRQGDDVVEGDLVIEFDRFHEFQPCQDGGVAAFIYEHGDSGCGDANYPKTLTYVAGWGYGHATLDGEPLYDDYEVHFMITQGMRDRETLKTSYPMLDKPTPAGAVNPAMVQVDMFIRSPEVDNSNNPPRKVYDHFFCMEVTFK